MIAENWSHLLPIYCVEKKKCQTASGLCDSQIHTSDTLNTFFLKHTELTFGFCSKLPSLLLRVHVKLLEVSVILCEMYLHVLYDSDLEIVYPGNVHDISIKPEIYFAVVHHRSCLLN